MSSLPYKKKFIITQTYLNPNSNYDSGFHLGVDLVGLEENTIYAINDGTVYSAASEGSFGNSVVVKQQDNLYVRYSHLETIQVTVNQSVTEGKTIIGIEGKSGFVYGGSDPRHLDLRISRVSTHTNKLDAYLNPCEYLGFSNTLNLIVKPGGKTIPKNTDLIIYFSEIDRRAALYLADYLNCPTIDISLLPPEIIDQAFENIYVIGTAQKPVSKAVNIFGADRYETCKKVLDTISSLKQEKLKVNKKGISALWKI